MPESDAIAELDSVIDSYHGKTSKLRLITLYANVRLDFIRRRIVKMFLFFTIQDE